MSFDRANLDAQLKAGKEISSTIIQELATERGAHAETCVTAAARMGGTYLFRTFGLPTANIAVGSPVFSDMANERGPVLVEVMKSALAGFDMVIDESKVNAGPTEQNAPLISLIETQQKLDDKLSDIIATHGLHGDSGARACALAAALLIYQTREMLDPTVSFGLAVYGFVEGTKTMPIASTRAAVLAPPAKKPWYKF